MESLAALLVAIVCVIGAFYAGMSYGKERAYDQAFDNAIRTINEVYEEDPYGRN